MPSSARKKKTTLHSSPFFLFFFFNDTATTEIYTLSLHDALPISPCTPHRARSCSSPWPAPWRDRKSTRLNSSHVAISYAVFCSKKKNHTPLLSFFLVFFF